MVTSEFKKELLSLLYTLHNQSIDYGTYKEDEALNKLFEQIRITFGDIEKLLDSIEYIKFKGATD